MYVTAIKRVISIFILYKFYINIILLYPYTIVIWKNGSNSVHINHHHWPITGYLTFV